MVTPAAPAPARPRRRLYDVGVVEPNKTRPRIVMQSERVTQAVGPFRRRRNPPDDEFHPVFPNRIDHQHLAVEIQKGIQTRVTVFFFTHLSMLSLTDNHINWFPQNTQNTDRGSLQNRKISPNPRGRSRKNKINLRLVFSDTYGDVRSAIGPRAGMRLAKLRLEETGEDVDHRTNTTVSRPRQFRVALRIVVIPRGWLRLSRGRHCCRSKQGRTAGASSIGQRRPDVARVFVRAVSALVPAPSSVQPNC